jgi:hypothetical protein
MSWKMSKTGDAGLGDQAESLRRIAPAIPWYRRLRRWWLQCWSRN